MKTKLAILILLIFSSITNSCDKPKCSEFKQCLIENGESEMTQLLSKLGQELENLNPELKSKEVLLKIIKDAQNGVEIPVSSELLENFHSVPVTTYLPQCIICCQTLLESGSCIEKSSLISFSEGLDYLRLNNDYSYNHIQAISEQIPDYDIEYFLPFYYFIIYLSIR